MRTIRTAIAATAAAGAAMTLALATGQASAGTRAPQATADPSTGLTDGQTISVTSTGWGANQALLGSECAVLPPSEGVPGNVVCDAETGQFLTADANGSVTFEHAVRKSFVGYAPPGRDPWGTVDCSVYRCAIGVTDQAISAIALAPISFG